MRKVVGSQRQAVMNECGARGVGDRHQGLREGPKIVAVVANSWKAGGKLPMAETDTTYYVLYFEVGRNVA